MSSTRTPKDLGKGGLPWLILAGLFCGLTAYTYLAARAFPVPLAAALLTALVADRDRRRARLGQLVIFAAVAVLALAPLARYWLTHPGSFMTRTQQVAAASWTEAWAGVRACLGMFFLRGDPYIRFNIPHRPLFDPITAILFLLGLAATAWQFGRSLPNASRSPCHCKRSDATVSAATSPRHPVILPPCLLASRVFLLTCLPIMLLPSALAVGDITPSNLRTVGLLPFIYVFPALGLQAILNAVRYLLTSKLQSKLRDLLLPASCTLLLVLSGLTTTSVYFNQWATSAELYYAADGDLADVAAYLNQADLTATTPYVASIHYRHPTLAFLAKDYRAIRWLTGGKTIVLPAEGDALLAFPHSASGDLTWVQSILPDNSLATAPPGPDGVPAFHAYRVGLKPDGSTVSEATPAQVLAPTHPLTTNLGHVVHLLGYDVIGRPRSNERAEVAVWWRVLNPPPANVGDYGPVARLTDPWGSVWGETQPFHYPSEQWAPGEWIVDHISIPVAAGAPPGDYAVRISLYSASADSLLPTLDDVGRYTGTTVQLPLRLARAAPPPGPGKLPIRNRLDVHADGLTLLGFNLDTNSARPGERLYLTLFWRADEFPLPDTDVTLTLDGVTLYAGAPVHDTYPTSDWVAGEIVADRYDPRLPRDTPPGEHPLQLRLNAPSASSGQAPSASSGQAPSTSSGQAPSTGFPRRSLSRAESRGLGQAGQAPSTWDGTSTSGQAPSTGFPRRSLSRAESGGSGQAGQAPSTWDGTSTSGYDLTLDLGTVTVQAINRVFDVPPISHPLTATLGSQVQLLGYDLPAGTVTPGDTLALTLYWRALTEMDENYTVFTHLLAPDGSTTGQRDSHPVNGTYPTSLWLTGEVVTDVYEIPIHADAAPGTHRLEVGMYVAETGDRLPTGTPDGAVTLQTVTLTVP